MKAVLDKYENRTKYINIKKKQSIYIHSNPIRDIFGGETRRKGMEWGKAFNGTTHNCDLRSTRATRRGRWKSTMNGKRSRPDAAPQGQYLLYRHADYRQPGVFQRQDPKGNNHLLYQRAVDFLIDRVGRENIVSAVVHMDEKTPHLHLVFFADNGQPFYTLPFLLLY